MPGESNFFFFFYKFAYKNLIENEVASLSFQISTTIHQWNEETIVFVIESGGGGRKSSIWLWFDHKIATVICLSNTIWCSRCNGCFRDWTPMSWLEEGEWIACVPPCCSSSPELILEHILCTTTKWLSSVKSQLTTKRFWVQWPWGSLLRKGGDGEL